jgi:hypothetical protein
MLMNHPNTRSDCISGRMNLFSSAIDEDLSGIRLIKTEQNVHQGRFSSSVFTEKGMDLSLLHAEIDTIIGYHPGKAFMDPYHFQRFRHEIPSSVGLLTRIVNGQPEARSYF